MNGFERTAAFLEGRETDSLPCLPITMQFAADLLGCRYLDYATGASQVLLGDIDPVRVLRNGDGEGVVSALAECRRQAGARYIVGAGCEVPRDAPPENLRALVEFARSCTS